MAGGAGTLPPLSDGQQVMFILTPKAGNGFGIAFSRWVALTESTGSNRFFRSLRDQQMSQRECYIC